MTASATFRAMNTDIILLAPGSGRSFSRALRMAQEVFEEVEACLSRFRPESELSALNRSAGAPFHASPLLLRAVALARSAAEATGGLFDPTVLASLEVAGYDRSFELVAAGASHASTGSAPAPDFRSIRLDLGASTIALDAAQRIDLGGIGKGLAVDMAIAATDFLPDRCVNAGGDIAVRGEPQPGEGWTIELDDAGDHAPLTVTLRDAALATSTVTRRRWAAPDGERHHLIDPRTGRPSTSPLRTVTAVARSCVEADVAAKTALLLGEDGLDFLDRLGLHGFAVRRDGTALRSTRWPWR